METPPNPIDFELFRFYQKNMHIYSEGFHDKVSRLVNGNSDFISKSFLERVIRDSMSWPDINSKEGISITHGSVERSKDKYVEGFILNILNIRKTIPNTPDENGIKNYLDEVHTDDFVKVIGYLNRYRAITQTFREEIKLILAKGFTVNHPDEDEYKFVWFCMRSIYPNQKDEFIWSPSSRIDDLYHISKKVLVKVFGRSSEFMSDELFNKIYNEFIKLLDDYQNWIVKAKK